MNRAPCHVKLCREASADGTPRPSGPAPVREWGRVGQSMHRRAQSSARTVLQIVLDGVVPPRSASDHPVHVQALSKLAPCFILLTGTCGWKDKKLRTYSHFCEMQENAREIECLLLDDELHLKPQSGGRIQPRAQALGGSGNWESAERAQEQL